MDWTHNIVLLYFNKTVVPCGGAAFILCAVFDGVCEIFGLLNRDYSKKYCVFTHSEKRLRECGLSNDKNESLLSGKSNSIKKVFKEDLPMISNAV